MIVLLIKVELKIINVGGSAHEFNEEWVRYFYDELSIFENQSNEDVVIFDNSNYSVEKSADKIIAEYCKS